MGIRSSIEKKLQQMTAGNQELNKKVLKIKKSLDDVSKTLENVGKKEKKKQ